MLASEKVAEAFSPGAHASTFGGTPLVSAVALAVLQTLEEDDILAHSVEMGEYAMAQLNTLKDKHAVIEQVRGKGLMLGVQLSIPGTSIVSACMEKGFLINCIQDNILRFAPPLIIGREEIDGLVRCLDDILSSSV
jgi:acetylornithine aminotransferase